MGRFIAASYTPARDSLFDDARDKQDYEYRISLVELLSQIGSAEDLPALLYLADYNGKVPRRAALANAAQKAIKTINERLETGKMSSKLLRPSSMADGSDTLLRSTWTNNTEPDLLLRPTNTSHNDAP